MRRILAMICALALVACASIPLDPADHGQLARAVDQDRETTRPGADSSLRGVPKPGAQLPIESPMGSPRL
jgi:hypothetical protein